MIGRVQEAIAVANAGAGRRHGWLDRLERLCLAAHVALVKTASPREARRVAARGGFLYRRERRERRDCSALSALSACSAVNSLGCG